MWKEDYKITSGGIFGIGATVESVIYKTNIPLKTKTGGTENSTLHFDTEDGSFWLKDSKGNTIATATSKGTILYGEESYSINSSGTKVPGSESSYLKLSNSSLSSAISQSKEQVYDAILTSQVGGKNNSAGVDPQYTKNVQSSILSGQNQLYKSLGQSTKTVVTSDPDGPVAANPDDYVDPNADPADPDLSALPEDGESESDVPPEQVPYNDLSIGEDSRNNLNGSEWTFMRYPYNVDIDGGFHYMKIQTMEHIPLSLSELPSAEAALSEGYQGLKSTEERYSASNYKTINTILLPMYPGISESSSVDWGSEGLSAIQAVAAQQANNLITGISQGPEAAGRAARDAYQDLKNALIGAASNDSVKDFLRTYFAGQAVGANLFSRGSGAVVNPNLEVIFNGPRIRSFNYNFRFTPRDKKESEEVHKILTTFRKNMAVQRANTALFLKAPNVFKIKYMIQAKTESGVSNGTLQEFEGSNEENMFIGKIKTCALTDMSVDYTPDGSYSTFYDGSQTSVALSLTFTELEPIFADEDQYLQTGFQPITYSDSTN